MLIWLVDDGFYPEKNEKHQQKVWPKRSKTQTTCVCIFQSNNEQKNNHSKVDLENIHKVNGKSLESVLLCFFGFQVFWQTLIVNL